MRIQIIAARGPCHGAAGKGHGEKSGLARIELWSDSVEAFGVECLKLRGIDAPLSCCELQSVENGWQGVADVAAFVAADKATGPVDQGQVFLEVEQNAALELVCQLVLKGQ